MGRRVGRIADAGSAWWTNASESDAIGPGGQQRPGRPDEHLRVRVFLRPREAHPNYLGVERLMATGGREALANAA